MVNKLPVCCVQCNRIFGLERGQVPFRKLIGGLPYCLACTETSKVKSPGGRRRESNVKVFESGNSLDSIVRWLEDSRSQPEG